jgi:hypothetical protein
MGLDCHYYWVYRDDTYRIAIQNFGSECVRIDEVERDDGNYWLWLCTVCSGCWCVGCGVCEAGDLRLA